MNLPLLLSLTLTVAALIKDLVTQLPENARAWMVMRLLTVNIQWLRSTLSLLRLKSKSIG